MQLTEELNTASYQIRQYQPGSIIINDQVYTAPIILTPHYLGVFNRQNFLAQLLSKPQLIILGTNVPRRLIPAGLFNSGFPLEIMHPAAACRTYTILTSEKRQVLAILHP